MKDPTTSITIRASTLDELERCQVTNANIIDGAMSVLRDGEVVGITNEYGSCVYVDDRIESFDTPLGEGPEEAIEHLVAAALAVW